MLKITRVSNIFDEKVSSWHEMGGMSVANYVPSDCRLDRCLIEFNGKQVSPYSLTDNDGHLVIVDLPAGPLVGALVGTVALIGETIGWYTVTSIVLNSAAIFGLTYAGSALAERTHPYGTVENIEDIAQNQYTGIQTTVGSGHPIPFVLGEVRIGGQIIESYGAPTYDVIPDSDSYVTTIEKTESSEPTARALNTLIALCWGPIESVSSIEIDGNAIENVKGVQYETTLGTNLQRPPALFEGGGSQITTDVSSGILTASGSPHGPYQTATEVDTIALHFEFDSGLYETTSKGKIVTRDISLTIEYRITGGSGYTTYGPFTASGATRTSKPFWVLLPELARDYYDIRVTRNTADNSDPLIQDEFSLVSMTEIKSGSYAHPGIALLAIRQIPQERQGVPRKYTAVVKGANNVRVYTSTSAYTEMWTDNPAWLALHWICDWRYGLGAFFDYDDVEDMQEWIDAANWCDQMIDDGNGGLEKRATFNHEFSTGQSPADILKLFYDSCGLWIIEQAGKWRVVVDDDESEVFFFSEGAYKKDSLVWSFLGDHDRPNRIAGSFRNANQDYEKDQLFISDPTLDATDNFIETQVDVYGATGIPQVVRQLTKRMNASRYISQAVKFTSGYSGMIVRAGSIFSVATMTGAIGVGNGRLMRVSQDLHMLTIDSDVALEAANSYEISICHIATQTIETKPITVSIDETTNIIHVTNPALWDKDPVVGDIYSVGLISYSRQKFRCVRREINDDFTCDIEGIEYNPDIYTIEYSAETEPTATTYFDPYRVPSAVTNLSLGWRESEDSGSDVLDVIDCSWQPADADENIEYYEIFYRATASGTGWIYGAQSSVTNHSIQYDLEASTEYEILVRAVSSAGRRLALDDCTTETITTS